MRRRMDIGLSEVQGEHMWMDPHPSEEDCGDVYAFVPNLLKVLVTDEQTSLMECVFEPDPVDGPRDWDDTSHVSVIIRVETERSPEVLRMAVIQAVPDCVDVSVRLGWWQHWWMDEIDNLLTDGNKYEKADHLLRGEKEDGSLPDWKNAPETN